MHELIEEYYANVLTASSINGRFSKREKVKHMSIYDNLNLIVDVIIEEVKHAVFPMHPDKSPGPDGLNPFF